MRQPRHLFLRGKKNFLLEPAGSQWKEAVLAELPAGLCVTLLDEWNDAAGRASMFDPRIAG